jgi:hypothetical protein
VLEILGGFVVGYLVARWRRNKPPSPMAQRLKSSVLLRLKK